MKSNDLMYLHKSLVLLPAKLPATMGTLWLTTAITWSKTVPGFSGIKGGGFSSTTQRHNVFYPSRNDMVDNSGHGVKIYFTISKRSNDGPLRCPWIYFPCDDILSIQLSMSLIFARLSPDGRQWSSQPWLKPFGVNACFESRFCNVLK